jgi:acetylornithine deacetylase
VDATTQIRITRELVDIDSTTGREADAGAFLSRLLRQQGYEVVEQPVAPGRFNVFAWDGAPEVVFSTHYDCVPPHFPSRVEGDRLYGRGTCDAKGIAVAQMAAAARLRREAHMSVGLLFVVGEERGSDGARVANTIAPGSARFLINGEPTDNRLARATRGIYRVRLHTHGRAAHSSLPDHGDSAIEKLLDALVALRTAPWPDDPELGVTYYTVGVVAGGVAPNVIPPDAHAEVMFRTVGPHEAIRAVLDGAVAKTCEVEDVLVVPPVRFSTVVDIGAPVFNFATDVPFLDRWGAPLLVGPGSIMVAHTADEYVEFAELHRGVDLYVDLATRLAAQR